MTDTEREQLIEQKADEFEERITAIKIEDCTRQIIDGAAEEAERMVARHADEIRELAELGAEEYVDSLDLEAEEVEAQ
jgi:hypothetical protein